MSLSALIRKRDKRNPATAIPAIHATNAETVTAAVAEIASIAVAELPEVKPAASTMVQFGAHAGLVKKMIEQPMTAPSDTMPITIQASKGLGKEPEAAVSAKEITHHQIVADAWNCFLSQLEIETPNADSFLDDLRTCRQCQNLRGRICRIAQPGGLVSANRGYRPRTDVPIRCAGYLPHSDDPDPRPGILRWLGLSFC